VTIFFSDIVRFTDLSRMLSAEKVCDMLDRLYIAFDELANKHEVFKVETIGDAWMGVTNCKFKLPVLLVYLLSFKQYGLLNIFVRSSFQI
jgi:class 3 adenylate cyclase